MTRAKYIDIFNLTNMAHGYLKYVMKYVMGIYITRDQ